MGLHEVDHLLDLERGPAVPVDEVAVVDGRLQHHHADEPRREAVEQGGIEAGLAQMGCHRGVVIAQHRLERLPGWQARMALHLRGHGGRVGDHRVVHVDFHHQLLGVLVGLHGSAGQAGVAGSQHVNRTEQVHGVVLALHAPDDAAFGRHGCCGCGCDRGRDEQRGDAADHCR